jgi:hypothetical protein
MAETESCEILFSRADLDDLGKEFLAKNCVVYGGGLSSPLLFISFDGEHSLPIAESEAIGFGTNTAMPGGDICNTKKD